MTRAAALRLTRRLTRRLTLALLLLSLLPLAAGSLRAEPLSDEARFDRAPFAGYELMEVTYLLRAPDGSLLRLTRQPAREAGDWGAGGGRDAAPRVLPVFGLQGWLSGLLYRSPRALSELSDYVRESWAVILRMLDYLGVVVLFAGAWVLYFLVRPALLGVPDRLAFLLMFGLVAGLWYYATHLYLSVLYALGLMLLPAVGISVAAWAVRRAWGALVSRREQPAGP